MNLSVLSNSISQVSTSFVVLNRMQQLQFTGSHLAAGDEAKWVNSANLLDSSCGPSASNAEGGFGSFNVSSSGFGNFTSVVAQSLGTKWSLCYSFSGHGYFFFPQFVLRTKQVVKVEPTDLKLGVQTVVTILGHGLTSLDTYKFVSLPPGSPDAACATAAPNGQASALPVNAVVSGLNGTNTALFDGLSGKNWALCYNFTSKWVFYENILVNASGVIISANVSSGGANGGTEISFSGRGFRTDRNYTCTFRYSSQL